MTFEQVVVDIRSLVGVWLRSIRPGAEIVVEAIEEERVLIKTNTDKHKRRPIGELERIWKALVSTPAIHVDSVLGGSSSSRNQPETIFANLPYVEFMYIDGKKHLAFGEPSHPTGSIKRASHERTSRIIAELRNRRLTSGDISTLVVVASDTGSVAHKIEEILGLKSEAMEAGAYSFMAGPQRILLISSVGCREKISDGTYALVSGKLPTDGGKAVEILGRKMFLCDYGGLRVIVDIER